MTGAVGEQTRRSTETAPLVDRLLTTLKPLASDKPIEWQIDFPRHLTVRVENTDIAEPIGNVLDNACARNRDRIRITGISMAARALALTEARKVGVVVRKLSGRYAGEATASLDMPMPQPDEIKVFQMTPEIISLLDYTKGFGHTDLVRC